MTSITVNVESSGIAYLIKELLNKLSGVKSVTISTDEKTHTNEIKKMRQLFKALKPYQKGIPSSYKFNRDEANDR